MITEERREGKTPNGGVYSVAYYYDKDYTPVDKARATQMKIIEYSAEGNDLHRTYASVNGQVE